jgi:hypothetical protein
MIDTGHGVVGAANASFGHRNLFDRDAFVTYMRTRRHPYAALAEAMAIGGDAFTLDDATVAGADAAKIARQFGHHVTLFVNGYNVAEGVPYFFARLNAALDAATVPEATFDGIRYDLAKPGEKATLRKQVKRKLAVIGAESGRQDLVTEVGCLLGVSDIAVPAQFRTLRTGEIRELLDLGVEIQNHGWTHTRVGALTPAEHVADIRRGRDWLYETFGIPADVYAVPNGDGMPVPGWFDACRVWLLLDEKPFGRIDLNVFSRRTLNLRRRESARARALFGWLRTR